MKWTSEYSMGIDIIDEQHQKLFDMVGEIEELVANHLEEEEYDNILKLLIKLNLYAVYHFETEEKILTLNNYPNSKGHKQEHSAFSKYLDSIKINEIKKDEKNFMLGLNDFLHNWVKGHLIQSDSQYKDYFKNEIAAGTLILEAPEKAFPESLDFGINFEELEALEEDED